MVTLRLTLSLALFSAWSAHAATVAVTQGLLTLDYTGTSSLYLVDPNHFNQASSNVLTAAEIESSLAGDVLSNSGLQYGVNTGAPTSPAGRSIQNTTMSYDVSNLTGTVTGQVGLGGVDRWLYLGSSGFIMGDYTLEYSAARAVGVKSGWYLENHYTFGMIAFDLANVSTLTEGDDFTLTGDLFVSPEFATNFGAFSDGSLVAGADYGNFSFTSAPEPSRALFALIGIAGVMLRRRRTRLMAA